MYIALDEIRIRNAVSADARQLADWWNDGAVMAHAGFPNGLGITAEEIARSLAGDRDDKRRRLIIEYRAQAIGEMSFSVRDNRTAEIGIKICNPDYREKGLGRIVLSMLIHELFFMGCEKVVLDTNLENRRAQHVYELLGFEKKRVNIDSWTDQLGRPQSSVDYELTPERFRDFSAESGGNAAPRQKPPLISEGRRARRVPDISQGGRDRR